MNQSISGAVHEANIRLHRLEAEYYELIHSEIFNKNEQDRITSTLKTIDTLIEDNGKRALDFGAGTGNLTGKLLQLGYKVAAVDISEEMCVLLRKRYRKFVDDETLRILESKIEDTGFGKEEFDLIACYSVLHHLPDYESAVRRLLLSLKRGGIFYLDHEPSPFYWRCSKAQRLMRYLYSKSNWLVNAVFKGWHLLKGTRIPSFDTKLSHYWGQEDRHVEDSTLTKIFEEEHFESFRREDYFLHRTWFFNPGFYMYKWFCKPDFSLWIAKK